ncbi:MAG: DUF4065 domain-containing protein [Anaerovoracaceae bacterium]
MDKTLAFCEECRDDVAYTITEVGMTGTIKGNEYSYVGKEAHCSDCGAFVYVPELNDANLEALYNVYRSQNDIVTLAVIRAISEKYAIGKRPLSLLLGWGEQTFSRYCDGDLPTKQYSDILTQIYNDPAYYAEILEKGKSHLKTAAAYDKSKKAVDSLLGASCVADSKINVAIQYLLSQCEDITPLALQKALYYIQGFYFAFYHNFLFSENCEAWVHGPVYPNIYSQYREYRFDPIEPNEEFDASSLVSSEKAIYDSIINSLCCYSGKVLERFTHNETPWLSARGSLPISSPSNEIISRESIGEYFSVIKEKYNMVKPNDIRTYAQEMFLSL